MANKVYTQALGGVQNLISARVASRALDSALKARGETPETVNAEVMSRILLGPILNEFETILPPEGLKRQLRNLAAGLRKNFPKPAQVTPEPVLEPTPEPVLESTPDAEPTHKVDATNGQVSVENDQDEVAVVYENAQAVAPKQSDPGFVYQTNALSEVPESLDLMASEASAESAVEAVPDMLLEIPTEMLEHVPEDTENPSAPPAPSREPARAPVAQAPAQEPLSQERLEAAVLRLAQLEQVKFVAALRSSGEVAARRGTGIDVDALAQLGLIGLKLLRRSGPLRTYYLAHTQGQLFLLPLGDDTLTLVGTPELNVGAVFNAFATLKEER